MTTETATAPPAQANGTDQDEPVVVFEHVSLAFDDKVILKDVSFTLRRGHTKIILGASGAGKSLSLNPPRTVEGDGGECRSTANASTS